MITRADGRFRVAGRDDYRVYAYSADDGMPDPAPGFALAPGNKIPWRITFDGCLPWVVGLTNHGDTPTTLTARTTLGQSSRWTPPTRPPTG